MKIFTLLFFISIPALLNAIVEIDETQYSDKILGTQELDGAMFLGEKIWQDQPINGSSNLFYFSEAKEYCSKLDLLGLKEWELPSKADLYLLDSDLNKFKYTAGYPFLKSDTHLTKSRTVRCVLNPNIYNKKQRWVIKESEAIGTVESFLTAFKASGDKTMLKKAISLSTSIADKRMIETSIVEFLGALKVFDIKSNGEVISDNTKKVEEDMMLFNLISKRKTLKTQFQMSLKKDSPIQPQYNSYKIKIRFILKLTYRQTMKKALFGLDFVNNKTEKIPVEVVFMVSPNNHYSQIKNIDFGKILQGNKGNVALFFTIEQSLVKTEMIYDLISIESL